MFQWANGVSPSLNQPAVNQLGQQQGQWFQWARQSVALIKLRNWTLPIMGTHMFQWTTRISPSSTRSWSTSATGPAIFCFDGPLKSHPRQRKYARCDCFVGAFVPMSRLSLALITLIVRENFELAPRNFKWGDSVCPSSNITQGVSFSYLPHLALINNCGCLLSVFEVAFNAPINPAPIRSAKASEIPPVRFQWSDGVSPSSIPDPASELSRGVRVSMGR